LFSDSSGDRDLPTFGYLGTHKLRLQEMKLSYKTSNELHVV
jgi:hypothetical protein